MGGRVQGKQGNRHMETYYFYPDGKKEMIPITLNTNSKNLKKYINTPKLCKKNHGEQIARACDFATESPTALHEGEEKLPVKWTAILRQHTH